MKAKIIILFLLISTLLKCNNLQISGISVNQTTKVVSFTVSWDNGWRVASAPNNWDAVWLFVKFRNCSALATVPFTHGVLSSTTSDHNYTNAEAMSSVNWNGSSGIQESAVQGSTLDYTEGIMLRRNSVGSGSFSSNVSLKVTNLPAIGTDITTEVLGLEMVYIPQNNFYVGDGDGIGGGSNYRFGTTTNNSTSVPMVITNLFETATSSLYTTLGYSITNIPSAWPKGQCGFYLMKYEITEGAYAEFLNTIGSTAAVARYGPYFNNQRNQLSTTGSNYTGFRPDRAQNFLSWADLSAFLDWACLRPMTELEYEKAARGTLIPLTGEYSWGNTTISQATTFASSENGTEVFTGGNCNYGGGTFTGGDGGLGPCRVGIFATSSSNRTSAGAGYYGVMELTGNVFEYVISLVYTTPANNIMKRVWGDGVVDVSTGVHNTTFWPIGTYAGIWGSLDNLVGSRGGDYNAAIAQLRLSERYYNYYSYTDRTSAFYGRGGRGAR